MEGATDLKFCTVAPWVSRLGTTEAIFDISPLSRATGGSWGYPWGPKIAKIFFWNFDFFYGISQNSKGRMTFSCTNEFNHLCSPFSPFYEFDLAGSNSKLKIWAAIFGVLWFRPKKGEVGKKRSTWRKARKCWIATLRLKCKQKEREKERERERERKKEGEKKRKRESRIGSPFFSLSPFSFFLPLLLFSLSFSLFRSLFFSLFLLFCV